MYTVNVKGSKVSKAASFADAARIVRAAWSKGRSSVFYADRTAGLISDESGAVVAHVSFNGKVWRGANRVGISEEIATY